MHQRIFVKVYMVTFECELHVLNVHNSLLKSFKKVSTWGFTLKIKHLDRMKKSCNTVPEGSFVCTRGPEKIFP